MAPHSFLLLWSFSFSPPHRHLFRFHALVAILAQPGLFAAVCSCCRAVLPPSGCYTMLLSDSTIVFFCYYFNPPFLSPFFFSCVSKLPHHLTLHILLSFLLLCFFFPLIPLVPIVTLSIRYLLHVSSPLLLSLHYYCSYCYYCPSYYPLSHHVQPTSPFHRSPNYYPLSFYSHLTFLIFFFLLLSFCIRIIHTLPYHLLLLPLFNHHDHYLLLTIISLSFLLPTKRSPQQW